MILLFGRADDTPLEMVSEALASAGAHYMFVDQLNPSTPAVDLEVSSGGLSGTLCLGGVSTDLTTVTAIYARPLEVVTTSDRLSNARANALREAVAEWMELTPAFVVSRPSAMETNASKPYQSKLITACGLPCPTTLVTNDPDAVLQFRREQGRIVYKSISGVRSIVQELTDADLDRLDRLPNLPTQFQGYIEGDDVRVHVVGQKTFATLLRSSVTDYRYAHCSGTTVTMAPHDLPADIAERCVATAEALSLPFCGIDLRCTPDGRYVCFEANPMPAFSYYEMNTGAPIAQTLARLLMEAPRG